MMYVVAYFAQRGAPKTGLSPTLDIYRVSDNTQTVTGAAMTEIGGGSYKYDYSTFDNEEEYYIVCDGTVTLRNTERYAITTTGDSGVIDRLKDSAEGRYKIENNQLNLYKSDGTTIWKTFNLKDGDGAASSVNVYERVPT